VRFWVYWGFGFLSCFLPTAFYTPSLDSGISPGCLYLYLLSQIT